MKIKMNESSLSSSNEIMSGSIIDEALSRARQASMPCTPMDHLLICRERGVGAEMARRPMTCGTAGPGI